MTQAWLNVQLLVFTLKCFSTLSKTFVPLSLAELHRTHAGQAFDHLEESYSSAHDNAFFVVLVLSMCYNWFSTKPPTNYVATAAVIVQGISCMLLVAIPFHTTAFATMTTLKNFTVVFSILHFLQLFSMFLLSQHVTYYSVHNTVPSSKLKLIPTIVVAFMQILFLYFTEYLASTVVFIAFALILFVALLWLQHRICLPDNVLLKDTKQKTNTEHVPLLAASIFIFIAMVGLNGEQLLDSIMSVKIRDEYFAGNKESGIAKQFITIVSTSLALLSTFNFTKKSKKASPTVLICLWAFAQFIRVIYFSDTYNNTEFIYVVILILLDKYTGTLGEIALEQSLLHFLHAHETPPSTKPKSFVFSMLWLMSVYGFMEDFTQGVSRKVVRAARKALPDSQPLLFAFWQSRSIVVCALVCVATLFVLHTEHARKGKTKKMS